MGFIYAAKLPFPMKIAENQFPNRADQSECRPTSSPTACPTVASSLGFPRNWETIMSTCHKLDSPYGELKFAPPKAYFIDLRQIRANLLQILTKIINIHKMHVQNIQGCHFLRKKSPCGTLHNIAKGLVPLFAVNHSAICRYLPLSAAICRYLPLTIPLFAAICR